MTNLKKLSKRGLALLLAFVMCLSMIQVSAFAADEQEHIHNADGWVCTQAESTQELACDKHVHEDSCFETQDTLACELEEHTHGEGCYEAAEPVQVCEEDEHAHEAGCYDEEGALTCEAGEHTHDSSCFETQEGVLACASEEHTHGGDCYVSESVQVCPEEDHEHSEECYAVTEGAWTCAAPEAKDEAPEVPDEVPAEVQAFLDAVEAIPEITTENAAEAAEYLYGEVAEAYEALIGTEFEDRDDVQEAAAVYAAALDAVDEALGMEGDSFAVTARPYKEAFPNGVVGYAENPVDGSESGTSGDTFVFNTLPVRQITGGYHAGTYYPDAYYYELKSISDSNKIISDISYSVGSWTGSPGYGMPCFQVNIDTNEDVSGTANVKVLLVYYISELKGLQIQTGEWLTGYFSRTMDCTITVTEKTYTVTYTDGVEDEIVFADQAYEDLKAGDETPKFEGTTTREGYTFEGWAPAVKDTVDPDMANEDGEIIYTATWSKQPGADQITGFTKELVKSSDEVPSNLNVSGITYPNTDGKVTFPESGSVTLLYKITVTGTEGTKYNVTDKGATHAGGAPMEGTIPESGSAVIYVTKSFTKDDINEDGNLVNTASVTPGVDSGSTSDTETTPVNTIPYTLVYAAIPAEKDEVKNLPASETKQGTAPGSVDFTVSSQVPTREGYTFAGWEVQNKVLHGGDTHTVTASANAVSVTEYLYAKWTKNSEKPEAPVIPGTNGMLRVQVVCDSKDTGHSGEKENLRLRTSDSNAGIVEYTAGEVVASEKDGYEWQCTVKLYKSDFAARFQHNSGGDHTYTAATKDTVDVTFYYKDGAWDYENLKNLNPGVEIVYEKNGSENYFCNYVVYHVEPKLPDAPTPADLQQVGVQVKCGDNSAHDGGEDWWKLGGEENAGELTPWRDIWRTIGEVEKVGDTYQCVVTVHALPWADLRINGIKNSGCDIPHVFDREKTGGSELKVTFTLVDGKWTTETAMVFIWLKEDTAPSLTISKTVDEASVKVGEQVAYTITVKNTGNAPAHDVKVSDPLNEEFLQFVSATLNGAEINPDQDGVYTIGELAAGGSATLVIHAKTIKAGEIPANTAKVTSKEDPTGTENSSDPVKVGDKFSIRVTKSRDSEDSVTHGSIVDYTVKVTNTSTASLWNLVIDDTMDPGLTLNNPESVTATTGGEAVTLKYLGKTELDDGKTKYSWEMTSPEEFKVGETVTLTYSATVSNPTSGKPILHNVAHGAAYTSPENPETPEPQAAMALFANIPVIGAAGDRPQRPGGTVEGSGSLEVPTRGMVEDSSNANVSGGGEDGGDKPGSSVEVLPTYTVTYIWSGLPEGAAVTLPTDSSRYSEGDAVTVDTTYTKDQEITVDGKTYVFSGWSTDDFTMPAGDVTISGSWTEKEADKFTVTYSWTGLPEGTADPAAPAAASYEEGDTVTVDTRASGSEVTVNGRTYVFSGWNRTGSFEMPAGNVTISGTWSEKQYRVTYSWTGLPEGAAETLPNGGMYVEGALVNVDSMYTNGRTTAVNGRTYVFSGWNRTGSFEMPGSDVTISGTWTVQSGGGSDVNPTPSPSPSPSTPVDPSPSPSPSPSPTTPVDPRPSTPVDPDDGDDDPPTRPVNPVTPVNPDGGDDDGTPDVPPVTPDTPDVNIPEEDVPPVNVPDVDVPLAGTPEVDVPDADVPLTGVPEEVVIPDVDVPLADTPDVPVMDIPVADVPMGNVPAADVVDIPNANVPLADVPKTGDDSRIWTLFALISGLGLAWLMLDKKREAIEK